jgi:hypothetical protein
MLSPESPEYKKILGLKKDIGVELRQVPENATGTQSESLPGPLFDIFNKEGDKIGWVALNMRPQNPFDPSQHKPEDVTILNMDIHFIYEGKYSNQGYGKLIYAKIQEMLRAQGKKLVSSGVNTDRAIRVWESLQKRKLATKDPKKGRFDHGLYKMK